LKTMSFAEEEARAESIVLRVSTLYTIFSATAWRN
jgi:hypothetical protein